MRQGKKTKQNKTEIDNHPFIDHLLWSGYCTDDETQTLPEDPCLGTEMDRDTGELEVTQNYLELLTEM